MHFSRRGFIKTSALAAGAIGAAAAWYPAKAQNAEDGAKQSSGLTLTGSGYRTKRTEALFTGRVEIDRCSSSFEPMGIGDINANVFEGPQSLDVTEIGLHPFMLAYVNDGFRDYTLLPVFPFRVFRHKSVFINTDSGIQSAEDLKGKKIATPGYSSTSLTWIRGILQHEYGVSPQDVEWVLAAKDSSVKLSGKASKQEQVLPEGLTVTNGPEGRDESDLLESGEVDALFHAVEPRGYTEGHPKIERLFADYRTTERAYYAKTGIFPIMHAVAIRKSILEDHPWLAEAVFRAYSQAKQLDYELMAKKGWYYDMLPWYAQELEETRALMGSNFYSYGLEKSRAALEALFRYSYEQGLSRSHLTIEELFDPLGFELTES